MLVFILRFSTVIWWPIIFDASSISSARFASGSPLYRLSRVFSKTGSSVGMTASTHARYNVGSYIPYCRFIKRFCSLSSLIALSTISRGFMFCLSAPPQGFEPRLNGPKPFVLPVTPWGKVFMF